MKKFKNLLISFLVAACAVCLSLAFVACSGGGDKSESKYGYGEEGVYYYSANSDTDYLMTLQSGTYMISAGGVSGYSGTYSYDADDGSFVFTSSDGEKFEASFAENAMQLAVAGTPYTFLKKVDYSVKFVDGSATVTTQSVTYGKSAKAIDGEKSGYIFIGWYEDASFTTQYKFNTAVTGDTTLYAYYIEEDSTISNFDITYISDGKVVGTAKTQNGMALEREMPEVEGILGWWVSDTNKEDELTYKYDGQVLGEATNLYAVKNTALGASVYDDEITWSGSVSSVTITVDGAAPVSATGNSYSYSFKSLSTGRHEIEISASGYGTETLVYVVNGLARVSNFAVYGTTLVYNRVENAQYYYISVTCANPAHEHTMVYNGNTLTYDFSNCEMGSDGITFTVYAYGTGYLESVSETYVYRLVLDGTEVSVDASTDTASWAPVENATGYEVYVNGECVATLTTTEYSLKNYGMGTVSVSVKPVAPGYYSEASEAVSYEKATLPAPEITGINEYTVSWTEVVGATNYIIYVNGKQIETVSADITEYAYALDKDDDFVKADSYVITIKATNSENANQNSQESDPVYATDDTMSPLLVYEDGVVYWQYAMAVGTYYVTVNDENETAVEGKNSFDVTFTQSGENVIKVYFNDSAVASLSVTAYAVIFDTRGGETVETVYLAKGDTLVLPDAYLEGYEFSAWYTLPDLTNFDQDATVDYSGDGTVLQSGTVFDASSNQVYYAFYTPMSYVLTLYAGDGYFVDENGDAVLDENGDYAATYVLTVYYNRMFTLPEVVATKDGTTLAGWYDERNRAGNLYADEYGNSLVVWNKSRDASLYASYYEILSFSVTTYNRESVASVSKGYDISTMTEVTVPETCTINGTEYTVAYIGSSAFNSCSRLKVINIPDTVQYIATGNNGYSAGSGAFAQCGSLTAVNIYATGDEENTTREIVYYSDDNGALYHKSGDGVELIYWPRGRSGAVVIPETVSNEYEYELNGTDLVKVNFEVKSIAQQVFRSNLTITSVTIPYTVETVGAQAFYNASGLTAVVFEEAPDGADATLEICANAFQNCSALTSVTLPSHLAVIDASAFNNCLALTAFDMKKDGAVYTVRDGYLCNDTGNTIVFVPRGVTAFVISDAGVTGIGDSAFESCEQLQSVTIGATISSIGSRSFYGCYNLVSLTFQGAADSVSLTIGEYAFYRCYGLKNVTLPENLTSLGAYAFGDCIDLTEVTVNTVGESISFAASAFANTSGEFYVKTVNIGAGAGSMNITSVFGPNVTKVTLDASNTYYALIDDVLYNSSVTEIAYYPYGKDTYSTPDTLTTISAYAFQNRTDLKSVTIGRYVTEIGTGAFSGCTNLETVTFLEATEENPGEATSLSIGASAFANCSSLKEISVPERTVSVGSSAFAGCSSIESFTITKNLTIIGENDGDLDMKNVFSGCDNLTHIEVETGNSVFSSENGVIYDAEKTQIFYVSKDTDIVQSDGSVTIPKTVTKVWAYAFEGIDEMTALKFEEGTDFKSLELGEYAFANCENLADIDLPEGLTVLNDGVFSGCTSLTTVTIPTTVTNMGVDVFGGDDSLEEIEFTERDSTNPTSLTLTKGTSSGSGKNRVATATFSHLTALKSISLPEGTKSIPNYTFYGCTALESVYIPSTVTSIGNFAIANGSKMSVNTTITFAENSKLDDLGTCAFSYLNITSINLKDTSITSLDNGEVFEYTTATEIEFPETLTYLDEYVMEYNYIDKVIMPGVQTVGDYCFYGAHTKSVVLGDVKSIGQEAFSYCYNLYDIDITANSSGLTMGNWCFYNCPSITSISLPEGLTSLGEYAFYCDDEETALEKVEFPSTIKQIGGYCFYYCNELKEVEFKLNSDGTSDLQSIGMYAFAYCPITSFSFPKTTATISIGMYVFYGCKNMTYLYISESVTDITNVVEYNDSVFETIKVAEGSQNFAVDANVPILFNAEKTVIRLVFMSASDSPDGTLDLSSYTTIEEIGEYAFASCKSLKKLILPEGLKKIGDNAFYMNSVLQEISIPSTIQTIGAYAFYQVKTLTTVSFAQDMKGDVSIGSYAFRKCTALETIDLSHVTSYGQYAFAECSSLKEITLAEGLTSLGGESWSSSAAYFFYKCTSLETVNMSSTLTTIGGAAFDGCAALTGIDLTHVTVIGAGTSRVGAFSNTGITSLTIPSTMTKIGSYAFCDCTSLQSVTFDTNWGGSLDGTYIFAGCTFLSTLTLPNSATFTSIPNYTFHNCSLTELDLSEYVYLTSLGNYSFYGNDFETVDISNVTSLGSYALAGCTNLKSITLPDGMTSLPTYAFDGCSALETISFGTGLTEIANYAFENCTSLKSVEIPSTITSVGNYAFYNCSALASVEISGEATIGTNAFQNCSKLENLKADYVTSVGNYAFDGCSALTEVSMPNLTSMGTYAFRNCTSMTTFEHGELTTIDQYAFYGCAKLETIDMSDVTTINAYAFYGCTELVGVDTSNVTTLGGGYTFYNCTSLVEIDLSSVTSLSSSNTYTFYGCTALETVILSDDLTYIPGYMFQNCTSLRNVDIPSALITIGGSYAFDGCESLESVVIPTGVTALQTYTFRDCKSLVNVVLMGNITVVPQCCFSGCILLETVELPLTVTTIDGYAFQNCESLTTISLPEAVTSVGTYAFAGCSALTSLIIPESTTSIGTYAFQGCIGLTELWIGSAVTSVGSNALSGCCCNLYIVNIETYITDTWGSSWISSTGFEGTAYYYFDAESAKYTDDGTAYAYNYWDIADGELVMVEYSPDVYAAEDCYVLYNADLDEVVGMYVYDDSYEDYISYKIIDCEAGENVGYIVTVVENDDEVSYSVVLDADTMTATVTAEA